MIEDIFIEKEEKKGNVVLIVIIGVIIALIGLLSFILLFNNKKEIDNKIDTSLVKISYKNEINENDEYHIIVSYTDDNPIFCSIDNSNYKKIEDCEFDLKAGKYTIYLKKNDKIYKKNFKITKKIEGEFSSTLDRIPIYYLALNGTKIMHYSFNYPETFDKSIYYHIDNNNIISIENNTIHGLQEGITTFSVKLKDGNEKKYTVQVTSLIQPFSTNNNKPYLPCKRYSEEEASLLDNILFSRVEEAGVGTRGAVLAAARFLSMEFPYSIRYFNENGRLNGYWQPKIDGEGRYYHKGLYLSESKYKDISASTSTGPKIWGCEIYDQFISRMNMNGFTCSGFVSWAMLNGGYDVGDVGAGDYPQITNELSDIGPHQEITTEYMTNGNFKAGDFIGRDEHAALIIGVDDNYIYTAEAMPAKLEVYTYERYHGIVNDYNLTYIIEMTNIYPNGDGWYTNMWNE